MSDTQAPVDLGQAAGREALAENPRYLSEQLVTYIGNKRALLDFIGNGVRLVKDRLGKTKLSTFDVFSGSGVVARYLRRDSDSMVVNDLEAYSTITNRCYLANPRPQELEEIEHYHRTVLRRVRTEGLRPGFIAELYAPALHRRRIRDPPRRSRRDPPGYPTRPEPTEGCAGSGALAPRTPDARPSSS